MRGGQVSVEYLLITAFSFLLLVPLLILFYVQFDALQDDASNRQALTATQTLVQAAERVYMAGSPSQETVTVRIPAHVTRFRVLDDTIALTVARGPPKDIVAFTDNIFIPDHPELDTRQGMQRFVVRATPQGVQITQ